MDVYDVPSAKAVPVSYAGEGMRESHAFEDLSEYLAEGFTATVDGGLPPRIWDSMIGILKDLYVKTSSGYIHGIPVNYHAYHLVYRPHSISLPAYGSGSAISWWDLIEKLRALEL